MLKRFLTLSFFVFGLEIGTHSIPGQMAITNYMHKDSCSICHVEYKRGGAASRHETARHICAPCIRRPQFALTALAQSLNGITDQAASLSKICTNCSQIKHHVIVPLPSSGSIGDMPATSGRTDPHLHINHYLWAGGMGCDSDGRGHRDIESCISLDCALFYERAKVRNRHKELAQLLVYADEAVKVD